MCLGQLGRSYWKVLEENHTKSTARLPLQFGHSSISTLQCSGEPDTEYFSNKWVKYVYWNGREAKKCWLTEFIQKGKWWAVKVKAKGHWGDVVEQDKTLPLSQHRCPPSRCSGNQHLLRPVPWGKKWREELNGVGALGMSPKQLLGSLSSQFICISLSSGWNTEHTVAFDFQRCWSNLFLRK